MAAALRGVILRELLRRDREVERERESGGRTEREHALGGWSKVLGGWRKIYLDKPFKISFEKILDRNTQLSF